MIENPINTSYNSNPRTSKKKTRKNPNAYKEYIEADEKAQSVILPFIQKITEVCEGGLMFTKHNYGNLKSSVKFVRVAKDHLEYYKHPDASDSGTRCKCFLIQGASKKFFASSMAKSLQDNYKMR